VIAQIARRHIVHARNVAYGLRARQPCYSIMSCRALSRRASQALAARWWRAHRISERHREGAARERCGGPAPPPPCGGR
jgi:hypothetical protein